MGVRVASWKIRLRHALGRRVASDRVRSRLCVRQFRAEGPRDDLFAGTPDTSFINYLLAKAASCKDFGILVIVICVASMHARTDEESAFRCQEFKTSETQGSSDWNKESFKALPRVLTHLTSW